MIKTFNNLTLGFPFYSLLCITMQIKRFVFERLSRVFLYLFFHGVNILSRAGPLNGFGYVKDSINAYESFLPDIAHLINVHVR